MSVAPGNRLGRAPRQGLPARHGRQPGGFSINTSSNALLTRQSGCAQKIMAQGHGGSVFGVFLQLR